MTFSPLVVASYILTPRTGCVLIITPFIQPTSCFTAGGISNMIELINYSQNVSDALGSKRSISKWSNLSKINNIL